VKDSARVLRMSLTFDTLDDANFARGGSLLNLRGTRLDYSSARGRPVQFYVMESASAFSIGRLTVLGLATVATSEHDRGGFGIGGFLNLSGTAPGAIAGSQAALLAAVGTYRMGELPKALGHGWYLGLSGEAGNAWARRADVRLGNVRKAGSVFVGVDSILGPLYLAWGQTHGGDGSLYLFLGRPSLRQ
jgi:NTE family protein